MIIAIAFFLSLIAVLLIAIYIVTHPDPPDDTEDNSCFDDTDFNYNGDIEE